MKNQDMHRADIISSLKKAGTSMAALSRENGLKSGSLYNALARPWPKGERIIADALCKDPRDIWPTRYQQLDQTA